MRNKEDMRDMTDGTDIQDFGWVTARDKCSLPNEFERLKLLVEANVRTRKSCMKKESVFDFAFHNSDESEFSVSRSPISGVYGSTQTVSFSLKNSHILVTDGWKSPERRLCLTLTLTDDGECRFLIGNGEGEYLRWQIARRALCPLFFQGTGERGSP